MNSIPGMDTQKKNPGGMVPINLFPIDDSFLNALYIGENVITDEATGKVIVCLVASFLQFDKGLGKFLEFRGNRLTRKGTFDQIGRIPRSKRSGCPLDVGMLKSPGHEIPQIIRALHRPRTDEKTQRPVDDKMKHGVVGGGYRPTQISLDGSS